MENEIFHITTATEPLPLSRRLTRSQATQPSNGGALPPDVLPLARGAKYIGPTLNQHQYKENWSYQKSAQ